MTETFLAAFIAARPALATGATPSAVGDVRNEYDA